MSFFKTKYIPLNRHGENKSYMLIHSMIVGNEIVDIVTYADHNDPKNIDGFWEDLCCISYDFDSEHFYTVYEFLKSSSGIYFSTFMNVGIDVYFENKDMIDVVNVYFSLVCGEV